MKQDSDFSSGWTLQKPGRQWQLRRIGEAPAFSNVPALMLIAGSDGLRVVMSSDEATCLSTTRIEIGPPAVRDTPPNRRGLRQRVASIHRLEAITRDNCEAFLITD